MNLTGILRNRFIRMGFCLVAASALGGCTAYYNAPVKNPVGLIYQDTKAPLTIDVNGNPAGTNVTKSGSAKASYVHLLYFTFGWDSIAVEPIAKEAGIEEIAYADYEMMSILGIYREFTINVYGN